MSDGVIHTAFNHDFSKYTDNCETDRRAIEALGSVLAGPTGPGRHLRDRDALTPGRLATEDDPPLPAPLSLAARRKRRPLVASHGVRASVVRLPQVHDRSSKA